MNKQELKEQFLENIKNNEPKEFKIEKIDISDNHPILQNYLIKEAEEWVRPRTPEEIKQAKKDIKYKGLPAYMKVKKKKNERSNISFFGIRISWRF